MADPRTFTLNDGRTVGPRAPLRDLLIALGYHLNGDCELSDSQMLSVKSWLLNYAEEFEPGQFVSLEQTGDTYSNNSTLKAIVGKSPHGEAVLWHPPLPWTLDSTTFLQ